jgi:ubiquinone/menaquinone biosynthesis C-methylase UbiE
MTGQHITVDSEDFSDQGYAESTSTSYLSSIASSILRGVDENGRTYASYGKTLQGMPIDEQEQDRNDLQHAKFMLLLNGKLHLAPISEDPQKILDIGTGSGIWAIDMSDRYPSASVTGVDLAPTQPTWVPPNLQFEIEDIEEDWLFSKNSFDFIFGRELLMAIRDWPRVIQQAYDHLKPGGYLELEMTYPKTYCEDNSIDLETSAYAESARLLFECGRQMNVPWEASLKWKEQFITMGFEEVTETILPIPIGRW